MMFASALLAAASAVVLVIAGIGKVRYADPEALEELRAAGVPIALRKKALVRAHPWIELALAVGLLILPGMFGLLAGLLTVLLFAAYLYFIWNLYRGSGAKECACFGPRRTVDRRAVFRNVLLLLAALGALPVLATGPSVLGELLRHPAIAVAAILIAAIAWSVTPAGERLVDDAPYLRLPIPAFPLMLDGQRTSLPDIARQRAQVLLLAGERCPGCTALLADVPALRERFAEAEVDLRVLAPQWEIDPRSQSPSAPTDWRFNALHDSFASIFPGFGIAQGPAVVALGTDGLLAAGPAVGVEDVRRVCEALLSELTASPEVPPPGAADH